MLPAYTMKKQIHLVCNFQARF